MNSTSFVERGGRLARVDDGRTFVGCPGAPGWTTTCPEIDNEKKSDTAIVITKRGFCQAVKEKECMDSSDISLET
jgi:hypothetical protein